MGRRMLRMAAALLWRPFVWAPLLWAALMGAAVMGAVVSGAGAATLQSGALPVATVVFTQKTPTADIHAAYPRTGDARIDADLQATVAHIVDVFRREAGAAHDPSETAYTLDVRFRVARNDAQVFAVAFEDLWDMHGAHPNLEIVTANYLRDDYLRDNGRGNDGRGNDGRGNGRSGGWRVYLPELFDGRSGLVRIAQLTRKALDARLLAPNADPSSDPEDIDRGTAPDWPNFQAFLLLPATLEIIFPPYAVAAYAAGPQTVDIPLARLADVMRPNPRAPQPSFDCTRAATEDERAICSDVDLARLDRAVAETWRALTKADIAPPIRAKVRADQIAWLNARANTCRGHGPALTGAPRVACLTALYRARLAALEAEE